MLVILVKNHSGCSVAMVSNLQGYDVKTLQMVLAWHYKYYSRDPELANILR